MLASSSPRRRRLLEQIGVPFEAIDPGAVEVAEGGPEEQVAENAAAKARKVAERLEEGLVIGADTIVVADGRVLGKPRSASEAKRMLRVLSGGVHRVLTCVAVVDAASGRMETDLVETIVRMRALSEEEIAAYVATGEPSGKAGGYAIQGVGALLVEELRGCFYNVVGLPLSILGILMKRFGVDILKASTNELHQLYSSS
ncbi:MAG: Maf family protein [Candidatus Bathyarchaeia archaeon]